MNREILFEAKRRDNGEWVEGYYCKWKQIRRTICVTEEKIVDCIIVWMSDGSMSRREIDPDTLCQYTGLTDKNGRKIWENDIVKNKKRTEGFDWYKVVWRKDFADFGVEPIKPKFEAKYPMGLSDELTIYGRDYEVVGNVFDNPELLEVE